MRDLAIHACIAPQESRERTKNHDIALIGLSRLINRCCHESLREWLTLRCFLDARGSSRPCAALLPHGAITRYLERHLRDRHGRSLLAERQAFERRYLIAQLIAALTEPVDGTPSLATRIDQRVRETWSHTAPEDGCPAHAAQKRLDRALRTLTQAFMRFDADSPAPARHADAGRDVFLAVLRDPRSPREIFDGLHAELSRADGVVCADAAQPLDIVSKIQAGDMRLLRATACAVPAHLEVRFPTQPSPTTLRLVLPRRIARCLPGVRNPLSPLERNALKAHLVHLPACREVLNDDRRRLRLYRSAAARYATPPAPRRGTHRRAASWRGALLRGMLILGNWRGGGGDAGTLARHSPSELPAVGEAPVPAPDTAWIHDDPTAPWTMPAWAEWSQSARLRQEASPEPHSANAAEPPPLFTTLAPDATGTGRAQAMADAARETNETRTANDGITLIWRHSPVADRRRIVDGARQFALYAVAANESARVRDDDALRRVNQDGWYAYSNIPVIFLTCDKMLNEDHVLDGDMFHALLGEIGRAAVHERPSHLLCFENDRNGSLSWRVDRLSPTRVDVVALPSQANDIPDAAHRTDPDREQNHRRVLKQILSTLAEMNDPPFDPDALLFAMFEIKHRFDTNITHYADTPAGDVRSSMRHAALSRLIDINRREFPQRFPRVADIATPGALKFVDFLLGMLDPTLLAAPATLPYGGTEIFQARFGHHFSNQSDALAMNAENWEAIVARGEYYVKGWCVLTRDAEYLAVMHAENAHLTRHLRTLFANEIARGAWQFDLFRTGGPLSRRAIATQLLTDAGIPADHPVRLRKLVTLGEAQTAHSLLRKIDGGTLTDLYLTVDNGLAHLRDAEPAYAGLLPDRALQRLPSRRAVIALFNKAYEEKMEFIWRSSRSVIAMGFNALQPEIRHDFASAVRLRLHIYRPFVIEPSLMSQYIPPLEVDTHLYRRGLFGHAKAAIIETVAASGASRFYLFDLALYTIGNRTEMLTFLPEIIDAGDAGRYMQSLPDEFFFEKFPSIYEEPVYYKNDVEPHLQFECDGLEAVWESWINFRGSHRNWQKKALLEQSGIEKMQDDPIALYLPLLPFYTCDSVLHARALTLSAVLDGIFCLIELSALRHVATPVRTWIAHSAGVQFVENRLAWYNTLAMFLPVNSETVARHVALLRDARTSIDNLRRQRSSRDLAHAFRKISHVPFLDATSTTYRLYQATQIALELQKLAAPLLTDTRESPVQRILRWRDRNVLWGRDPSRAYLVEQQAQRGRTTIVGKLRHAEEETFSGQLREATCTPGVCVPTCIFDSLASLTTQRRMRTFVRLLDGDSPGHIARRAARQGLVFAPTLVGELRWLAADIGPLREQFAALCASDFAPRAHRREILNQALLHPHANNTESAGLRALPGYPELAEQLYALNFFFESLLHQQTAILDALTLEDGKAEGRDAAQAMPVNPKNGVCTRPGEDNEIRTCMLPITYCAAQTSVAADDG
ncbi:hypothetical protein OVY01_11055 [Robbsia sp. Bb-Pol-6]|uniref:Uncharacterized protein n=1 Tax=Robbsia betulipollinis TaxID=2981849 RepID=A0ABT3ZMJ4_9BURK|nr:hypothetical protein [Robbsia betulipollinis]MCY0387761.1 hypothetical protein [Robbsia betulipollinis]